MPIARTDTTSATCTARCAFNRHSPSFSTTAAILAVRDGLKDARSGRAAYLMTVLRNPQKRIGLLNEGLNATARIIMIGLAMDVIYQALVLKTFYPDEALVVALLLGFIPYLMIRGLAARVARSQQAKKQ